ncbi:MAG TPA: polysaccharide deacetylase family protein [Verrucomicrobiae bacterium]|jgi:peptidoglycan/xylan/chitin deacetylase (PgdA/CDA1 family)
MDGQLSLSPNNMSLDRELTTKVFHPLRRAQFWDKDYRLPILAYHSVSPAPQKDEGKAATAATDPFTFRQQMRQLITDGYNPTDIPQVVEWLRDGKHPPEKTVIITFDDGLRDFYTNAFPVLQEHSLHATVFLATDYIGVSRHSLNKNECLTWSEIREMSKSGIRFGSHGVSHGDLAHLPQVEVMRELGVSKAEIERQSGSSVQAFSYPHDFPAKDAASAKSFRDLLVKAGYTCCVTRELGRVRASDDLYRLKRIPINSRDTPALFTAKLEGGYDWRAWQQSFLKKLRPRKTKKQNSPQ